VNGNIGIGTTGPNKPLHIKGDSSINTAQLEIDGSGDTAKTYLECFLVEHTGPRGHVFRKLGGGWHQRNTDYTLEHR